jgi:hypothetical protein
VVGPRTKRGRLALVLAAVGGAVLVASAFSSWAQPARVPWPNYADGVPDFISHPSDALFRTGAGLVGVAALALVALARSGFAGGLSWLVLALLGIGGIAFGLAGFETVAGYPAFGSIVANDMTLDGFHHGVLNYVELAGAALLCVAPVAALRPARQ